ncbi:MAG: OmpA family protein [Nannocystaceae bacterium]
MRNISNFARFRVLPALMAVTLLPLTACGPIAFEDSSALVILGDPPPPPPKPEPEPEPKPKRVEVRDNRITISEKIIFDFNKATIREESFSLLKEIGDVIKQNPHIKKISIEGHTSSEGSDKYNQKLSDKRAASVRKHLIEKEGLADEQLVSKGFGESKPIADESTDEGKEKNRRVEFLILEQDVTKTKVEIDPDTGEEKVVETKTAN